MILILTFGHNFIIKEIQEDNMAHESNTNSRFDRDYEMNGNERLEGSKAQSETKSEEKGSSFCC